MHAEESEAGETNPPPYESDLVRIAAGEPKMVHPQTTTGKKSSEAVEERQLVGGGEGGGLREKNRFLLQNFCLRSQSTPCSFLTLSCQRRAAAAEQVRGGGCSREGGGKMWKSRN